MVQQWSLILDTLSEVLATDCKIDPSVENLVLVRVVWLLFTTAHNVS